MSQRKSIEARCLKRGILADDSEKRLRSGLTVFAGTLRLWMFKIFAYLQIHILPLRCQQPGFTRSKERVPIDFRWLKTIYSPGKPDFAAHHSEFPIPALRGKACTVEDAFFVSSVRSTLSSLNGSRPMAALVGATCCCPLANQVLHLPRHRYQLLERRFQSFCVPVSPAVCTLTVA